MRLGERDSLVCRYGYHWHRELGHMGILGGGLGASRASLV